LSDEKQFSLLNYRLIELTYELMAAFIKKIYLNERYVFDYN